MKTLHTPSSPLALYSAGAPLDDGSIALVLGHALGSDHRMWDAVISLLPDTIPVILWDQPGHGNSDLLNIARPNAFDTARALNNALLDVGVQKAHVAGLSLGGTVSLAYAQSFPDQTVTLGILDAGPANPPREMWEERAESVASDGVAPLVAATMQRWFTPAFASGTGAAEVAKIRDIFLGTDPQGYAQCCQILADTDLWPGVSEVAVETLVLTGEEDAGFTPEAAETLCRYLPLGGSPVIVPDARHLTAVQQPETVAAALQQLISSTES